MRPIALHIAGAIAALRVTLALGSEPRDGVSCICQSNPSFSSVKSMMKLRA
jgi:hypothetical protein